MLDLIRKKQRSVLIKIVFWTIIAAFVGTIFLVWGKGRSGQGGQDNALFRVNGDAVSYEEFQTTYENLRQNMAQRFGRNLPSELEKQLRLNDQAYNLLVNRLLLLQEADRRDLAVDKDELRQAIAQIPAFQRDGLFDRKTYEKVLAYQRLSSRQFERNMREQLLIDRLFATVKGEVTVDDQDIDLEYRNRNEKVDLSFVKLAPGAYENKVEVADAALQAYYEEHREDFRQPEKIALSYVLFEPGRYAKDISPDEEAIQAYYEKHKDRFWVPEQVKASHILFRITAGLDEAGLKKKRALAEEVLEKVKLGKDFADLARRYSDDAASAVKGGELGYFTRGTMVPDFENTAFSLQPGQVSDLVETSMGYHIIKCEGYIEGHIKPLDDVRDQVRSALTGDLAMQAAKDKAMRTYSAHRQDGDIAAVAQDSGLSVLETGLFARGNKAGALGEDADLNMNAFALKEGELAYPLMRDQGVITFVVKQRQESYVPKLEDVRTAVEQAYRRQESVALARQAAERILAAVQGGKNLAQAAREEHVEVGETGFFPRSYGQFVPRIGTSEALAEAAFTLTDKAPVAGQVFVVDERFVVATLLHRMDADPSQLTEAARQELRDAVLAGKQEQRVNELLDRLKQEAEIDPSPTLLNLLENERGQ